jgi:hypothetical protein
MRRLGGTWLALACAVGAAGLSPSRAAAQAPEPPGVIAPPAPATVSPAQLLGAADTAVDAGNLEAAAGLYDQLARFYPDTPEAGEARRALKILAARQVQGAAGAPGIASPPPITPLPGAAAPLSGDPSVGVVVRREPYSLRTSEKLRLSTWEKMDFGVTSFLYGMSVGFSFALGSNGDSGVGPVAIGALAYTLGAVAYLQLGNPDRGDLPLALAITSFLPTATLLIANIASEHPDQEKVGILTGVAGLVSVPLAIIAARNLDLDPGDMQLVRDSGFWGLVLGTTSMLAFGGQTVTQGGTGFTYSYYQGPSDRKVFTSSLIGLTSGLALGGIAAANSEVSLERVRVTTWGGYGGAVIGLLLGAASSSNSDKAAWTGITIGALAGLVITFASSSGLDGIPPEDVALRAPRRARLLPSWRQMTPTLLPVGDASGQAHTGLGVSGTLF